MSTSTTQTGRAPKAPRPAGPGRYRFTVKQYEQMVHAAILTKYDHVELMAGEVVLKMAMGPGHRACTARINHLFSRAVDDRAIVEVQSSIVLGEHCEPEPDVVILRWRDDFYATANPRPADVLLLI